MARSWEEAIAEVEVQRENNRKMGGAAAIQKLHERGKLTPRERIAKLLDPMSFHEIGGLAEGIIRVSGREDRPAAGDAVVCGWGRVDGRQVFVVADDGSVTAGARGPAGMRKAEYIVNRARKRKRPCVLLLESSALRMQEQMGARFADMTPFGGFWDRAGKVPVICGVMGTALGAASFRTMNADFSTMTLGTASMMLAGPPMVAKGTGEDITVQELGGAAIHASKTGFVDYVAADETENLQTIRTVLSYLPDSCDSLPPRVLRGDPPGRAVHELTDIVPLNHRKPYDMHRVIGAIVDNGEFLEIRARFAKNIVVGLARLDGHSVGILANQPNHMGGIVDPKGARKAVRFLQLCDAYHIPVIVLQDQPGFLIGSQSESEGALNEVVRLMNTISSMSTAMLTVTVRKAYGFSMQLLGGGRFLQEQDFVGAWPSASISLAGPELAVQTLLAREEKSGQLDSQRRERIYAGYRELSRARHAAYSFGIDELLAPSETRKVLCRVLEMTRWGPFTGSRDCGRHVDPP